MFWALNNGCHEIGPVCDTLSRKFERVSQLNTQVNETELPDSLINHLPKITWRGPFFHFSILFRSYEKFTALWFTGWVKLNNHEWLAIYCWPIVVSTTLLSDFKNLLGTEGMWQTWGKEFTDISWRQRLFIYLLVITEIMSTY